MLDTRTLGRARLSFADPREAAEFVATLERFERGELSAEQWRAYRLVRGIYGQRQADDAQMVRAKVPQGLLNADQLGALADVAERWSRGFCHVTTRQNLQFHFVDVHDVDKAMARLAEAGLTTREACGNAVRNVTACAYAGVAADEAFDVTPYAEAFTRHFLRHPLAASLPRKFKVAFEGCAQDHALLPIHDIGWRARVHEVEGRPRRGFRVTVGGGTSILCTAGAVLHEFLPAASVLQAGEAVVRVFHRLGDYAHRQRNRMKFLIRQLGFERWRQEYEQALAEVRAEGAAALPFDPESPPLEQAPDWPRPQAPGAEVIAHRMGAESLRGPGLRPQARRALPVTGGAFEHWRRTNVRLQKQAGHAVVVVTLPLGDVTAAQLRTLAELALAFADGTVRTTCEQDAVLRWVRTADLSELYTRLAAAGLGLPDANTVADVTSCPGAESCRLAVTHSRGLGRALGERLQSRPDLVAAAADLQLKISGCPNGCGRHHVAGIGFQGSVRQVAGATVAQYFVLVGGAVDDDGAQFGRLAAKVPARRVADALERLLELFRAERRDGEGATAFFRRLEPARARELLADLERIEPEDVRTGDDAEGYGDFGH